MIARSKTLQTVHALSVVQTTHLRAIRNCRICISVQALTSLVSDIGVDRVIVGVSKGVVELVVRVGVVELGLVEGIDAQFACRVKFVGLRVLRVGGEEGVL